MLLRVWKLYDGILKRSILFAPGYWFNLRTRATCLLGARAPSPARAEEDASQMPSKILRNDNFRAARSVRARAPALPVKGSVIFELYHYLLLNDAQFAPAICRL